jgi:molybdopterin synthase catalytic subunit
MHILGVTGPDDSDRQALVERLVAALDKRGRVATVHQVSEPPLGDEAASRYQRAGADTTYSRTDEGWHTRGDQRSLEDLLNQLAVEYDFVVVDGIESAVVPRVVLGGSERGEGTLATAETASTVDVESVVAALLERDSVETLTSLVAEAKASSDAEKSGAIATFTGRVRAKEHDEDARTEYLEFERYDDVATERMATIREELEARDGVFEVLLHHRTGIVEYGEDIVFVVVLAGHREEAFATVEDGINRLKEEVPLFKKEVTVNDEFWAHE